MFEHVKKYDVVQINMSRKVTNFFRRKVDEETSIQEESCNFVVQPSNGMTDVPVSASLPAQPAATSTDPVIKPFHPPTDFKFPKVKVGSRDRSCQANWFQRFPWLHYDTRFVINLKIFEKLLEKLPGAGFC